MKAVQSLSEQISSTSNGVTARAEIAAAVAAEHAEAVDRAARFPTEAFSALRAQRLLSVLVPSDLGGDGATVSDVVDLCYIMGRACASSAMIFAMHQIMVAILVRHAGNSAWHKESATRPNCCVSLRRARCSHRATGLAPLLSPLLRVSSRAAHSAARPAAARNLMTGTIGCLLHCPFEIGGGVRHSGGE